jgi:hypothetical protein
MFNLETLQPVLQDTATVVKYQSAQMPFSIVLAEVSNGTLKIEVSSDGGATWTRIDYINASVSPLLDIQRWLFARVYQNQIFKVTTTGGSVMATLRIEPTNLVVVP